MKRRIHQVVVATAITLGMLGGVTRAGASAVSEPVTIASDIPGPTDASPAPSAAYDQTLDRSLVAWLQSDPSGTVNVWGRFVTPDGVTAGAPFQAMTIGTGLEGRDALTVDVQYDPQQRAFVLFAVGLPNASVPEHTELYAQWLDDDGERSGGAVPVSRISAGQVQRVTTTLDAVRGRILVAYEADRPWLSSRTVLVQEVRRGAIEEPSAPFGAAPASDPSIAAVQAEGGPVLVSATRGPEASGGIQLATLGQGLSPARAVQDVETGDAVTGGTAVRWDDRRGRGILLWGTGAGIGAADLEADGTVRPRGVVAPGARPSGLSVAAVDRTEPWLVLASTGGTALTVRTLGAAAPSGPETPVVPDLTPNASVVRSRAPSSAHDGTREWLLVPYGARVGDRRVVAARVIAAQARAVPPPAPLQAPTTAPRCAPGAQLFALRAGSACAPRAVEPFTVAPLMDRTRRRLLGVSVQPTSRGARVRVECVARCGRRRPAVLKARGRARLTDVMFDGWRAPRRAVLEVRIERADRTTRFRRFGRRPAPPLLEAREQGCRLPAGIEAPC